MNPKVCEFMLSIDQKWLELSENNAEIVLKLIEDEKSDNLESIKTNNKLC